MIILDTANRKKICYPIAILMIFSIGLASSFFHEIYAEEQTIPSWMKIIAVWWGEDKITDQDFVNTFQYLVENKILEIPLPVSVQPECGIGLVLDEITNECVIHDEEIIDATASPVALVFLSDSWRTPPSISHLTFMPDSGLPS